MESDTVCKNNQHNGIKSQTLIPKNREMFIPAQPGRTNIQKRKATLVLSLQTNGYQKQKLKRSRNNKTGKPYLTTKMAKWDYEPENKTPAEVAKNCSNPKFPRARSNELNLAMIPRP